MFKKNIYANETLVRFVEKKRPAAKGVSPSCFNYWKL